MKKKIFAYILLIGCFFTISIAQVKTQKKATNKKPMLEIDRLYAKYKNQETITLTTTKGDFEGNVSIELNESNKPISVSIEGLTSNIGALSEFISNTIKMKLKQYNQIYEYSLKFYESSISNSLTLGREFSEDFSNGDLYFTVNAKRVILDDNGDEATYGHILFKWKIETGNYRRKISENAKPFVF